MPTLSTLTPYAAITLGSNSFNMLVATTVAGKPQIIAKYKRKVRLAEGIRDDGYLSDEVMQRGLDCLGLFAAMLKKHQVFHDDVAVIATATLRLIANADTFQQKALPILGHPIEIISGLREAELIYQGMVATTAGEGKRLVIDIGGASTEFIVGKGRKVLFKTSLSMGGVVFNQRFFHTTPFQILDFSQAKDAVKATLLPHMSALTDLGWDTVVGASGVIQSVVSVLQHRQVSEVITLNVLQAFRDEILAQADLALSDIRGLTPEQAPTFASGVAILLALFELLSIKQLHLAGGALREGVLQDLAEAQTQRLNT
ncbi:Ppx/GppA phosphatase family protein [Shewanella subflava]|uniref:Exopolyphosphatase n=1 Tax=Shewanella subflava TaxID=2986476 RepID=A0ABT3I9T9_9GAMM|nr:exopolyphosphatase [Shewanella subflava]MCW3172831.1 exopolyphosphatase [Shewanella subflava]